MIYKNSFAPFGASNTKKEGIRMKEVFEKCKSKMEKTIHALKMEYGAIRAGRANPQVLDRLSVDYYGTQTPINQLASVSATEARVLTVAPWDKSVLKAIEKAIQASDIGINPQNDGSVIRLTFPPLTEDRRKELIKKAKAQGETTKVTIRNARRDGIDLLKKAQKNDGLSEDGEKEGEDELQKVTDKWVKKVDEIIAAKEKDILTV